MASPFIADALRVSKSVFNRSAILPRCPRRCPASPVGQPRLALLRQAFAAALRGEWQTAKFVADQAAFEAEEAALPPLPAAIATYEPHSFAGPARFRALHVEAHELALAARLSMIPAQDKSHHAC